MDRNIVEYSIVVADGYNNLNDQVLNNIAFGWQPQGGLAFDGSLIAQAMVKYEAPLDQD